MDPRDRVLALMLEQMPHKKGGFIDTMVERAIFNRMVSERQLDVLYDAGEIRGLIIFNGSHLEFYRGGRLGQRGNCCARMQSLKQRARDFWAGIVAGARNVPDAHGHFLRLPVPATPAR